MFSSKRSVWQTLLPLLMFIACAVMQSACSCQSTKATSNNTSLCVPQHSVLAILSQIPKKTTKPGSTSFSFGVTAEGAPSVSLQLLMVPGRVNLAPDVVLRYAGPGTDGIAGNYGYCFVKEGDEIRDFALDEIRYGSFEGDESVEANRAVSFVYGAKEHGRTSFQGGHEFRQSLQLDKVVTSVKGTLARQYELEYDESETTGQTRLTSVQECGADGTCKI